MRSGEARRQRERKDPKCPSGLVAVEGCSGSANLCGHETWRDNPWWHIARELRPVGCSTRVL